jgi:hypothetical protein
MMSPRGRFGAGRNPMLLTGIKASSILVGEAGDRWGMRHSVRHKQRVTTKVLRQYAFKFNIGINKLHEI